MKESSDSEQLRSDQIVSEFNDAEKIFRTVDAARQAAAECSKQWDGNDGVSEYVPPRTSLESRLVEIWSEVLSVARIGVNDDFFVLGGHSLLGTQILSRIREEFSVELSLTVLFEGAFTIARLANEIQQSEIEPVGERKYQVSRRKRRR